MSNSENVVYCPRDLDIERNEMVRNDGGEVTFEELPVHLGTEARSRRSERASARNATDGVVWKDQPFLRLRHYLVQTVHPGTAGNIYDS